MQQPSIIKENQKAVYAVAAICLFIIIRTFACAPVEKKRDLTAYLEARVVDYAPVEGELCPLMLHREKMFEYSCNECHQKFQTEPKGKKRLAEHTKLTLKHGRNDYCLNCHHETNRNVYVTHDGKEILSDKPEELCAKCHGVVYRDWEVGAHGKLEGFWDISTEGRQSLVCIECHDPHDPKFKPLNPMPGPSILGRKTDKEIH